MSTTGLDVSIVSWPAEEAERTQLRQRGLPVLLLVEPGSPPPWDVSVLEDWVRADADALELYARMTALANRARSLTHSEPTLDEHGVLRFRGAWLSLSPIDARLIAPLLAAFEHPVEVSALAAAAWGEPPSDSVLRVRLVRLRRALATIGLTLHNVRGYGYALAPLIAAPTDAYHVS